MIRCYQITVYKVFTLLKNKNVKIFIFDKIRKYID